MKIDKTTPQFTTDEIRVIAQTFSSYKFENNEEGLYYKCKGEKGRIAFVTGYVQMGLLSGWIHTLAHTPGYISISTPQDKTSFIGIMKFLIGIVKGMGLCGAIIGGLNFLKSGKSSVRALRLSSDYSNSFSGSILHVNLMLSCIKIASF